MWGDTLLLNVTSPKSRRAHPFLAILTMYSGAVVVVVVVVLGALVVVVLGAGDVVGAWVVVLGAWVVGAWVVILGAWVVGAGVVVLVGFDTGDATAAATHRETRKSWEASMLACSVAG